MTAHKSRIEENPNARKLLEYILQEIREIPDGSVKRMFTEPLRGGYSDGNSIKVLIKGLGEVNFEEKSCGGTFHYEISLPTIAFTEEVSVGNTSKDSPSLLSIAHMYKILFDKSRDDKGIMCYEYPGEIEKRLMQIENPGENRK